MRASVLAVALPGKEQSDMVELVLRARDGEREAFGELVERLWPDLVALARAVLAVDHEAEDLVQEALVHAWQRLWTLRKPESFVVWVRRIVTRRCITWARRQWKLQELPEVAIADPEGGARVDARRLLGSLAPRQRAALYLTWIEGCTDREAGRILGLRPATVRVHRHRGLQRLRQSVEEGR
jgi:RNA polymerase sigma-70 factor (ECF subfamily)